MPPQTEAAAVEEEIFLLSRIGIGDNEAFRALYSRYSRPLFSMAIRFVGNTGEAEELLQDAFLKIWRGASSFDSRKSRPFTWAVTILRRTCIDNLRKRQRHIALDDLKTESAQASDLSAGGDSRNAAEAKDDLDRLSAALADTPQDTRRALELALYSELTHVEIAQRLGKPVGTVKSWIRRGMLGLRESLNEPT